ncbi:MAG: periplasmic sensor signal transduction histidine kinase [Rhodocyclales bacterium]|nr:periplasmic sensor signal transduction histidine kinase [Rhodocyclales bacterium]
MLNSLTARLTTAPGRSSETRQRPRAATADHTRFVTWRWRWHYPVMHVRYPGSFLKLLLIGFGLVALPLLVALGDAYISLEKLMQRSERSITHAVQITRDSRALGEQITALERLARQQLVLGERGVLDAYAARRSLFLGSLEHLQDVGQDGVVNQQLEQLTAREAAVWQALQQQDLSPKEARRIVGEFAGMSDTAREVLHRADVRIESDITELRERTEHARHQLLWRLLALVPVGVLLVAGVIFLIRRPIRQLGEGIRSLGDGQLDKHIVVRGPRDLEELGRELDWLRLRLNEVDEQKMRFLRHVSHELKTPLTAVHEGTQLLSEQVSGKLNVEQREIVGILRGNATRLRQLIENLLDYSGIRFHPTVLTRESVALTDLFAQIADDQKLALAARKLSLQAFDRGLTVAADRAKLRVVLDNLLSNAVKYAPEGSEIDLQARQEDDQTIIEIADQGPGVPMENVEQLFEPFVQGPPPRDTTSIKGTGLGLSIVRELVAAHGGNVVLLPNQPHGTRVRVSLPILQS